jgi:fatty-acyl-CoA synthase
VDWGSLHSDGSKQMRAIVENHHVAAPMARTPRQNSDIEQRLGGFDTIAEGLDYAARGKTGFNFYSSRGALDRVLPYEELRKLALTTARKLNGIGLKAGDRVGILAETGADFMAVFFGCQYAGFVPCPIPYSMHIGGKDAYITRVAGMLRAADANAVVTTNDMLPYIAAAAEQANVVTFLTHDELHSRPESIVPLAGFSADDVAYVQYSSGSTSEPKGVLITQRAIMANAEGILRHGLAITPADRAFSWLPLYHDMGLVGFCLAPMLGQVTVDFMSTTAFARRPALWLRLMSQNKSTVCYSPSFGYDLAARRINGEAKTLDLSSWRIAGIGGDMVRADVLNNFANALQPAQFDAATFLPSYGMAESTLAISFSPVDGPLRVDTISMKAYKLDRKAEPADGRLVASRSFVVCGKPLPGHTVQVRDDTGGRLKEREIGHIFVSGPSLMAGYFNREDATGAVLGEDGFLDTGDMGYLLDGAIVITGRAKDLILHNGRNIWPQDIEWAAEKIEPLKSGDVAAFAVEGEDGDDDVLVLVECRTSDAVEREALRREVSRTVHQSSGVDCKIVLVAPRSLPFTSSGKLSRAGARQKYLNGELLDLASLREPEFLQAAQ